MKVQIEKTATIILDQSEINMLLEILKCANPETNSERDFIMSIGAKLK